MIQKTTAIFEKGRLKPLHPLRGIPEHAVVHLTIEQSGLPPRTDRLAMLRAVPVAEKLADAIEEGRKRPWPVEGF